MTSRLIDALEALDDRLNRLGDRAEEAEKKVVLEMERRQKRS